MILLLVENFAPFKSTNGITCAPVQCDQGYFVPDGWQAELRLRDIVYIERDDLTITSNHLLGE